MTDKWAVAVRHLENGGIGIHGAIPWNEQRALNTRVPSQIPDDWLGYDIELVSARTIEEAMTMAVLMHEGFHEDGAPRCAESGGERYESCIRCTECGRIWWWGNVYVSEDIECICIECLQGGRHAHSRPDT